MNKNDELYLKSIDTLPELLTFVQKREGLSQRKMSESEEELGLGTNTVNTWINGKSFPRGNTRDILKEYLERKNPMYVEVFDRILKKHDEQKHRQADENNNENEAFAKEAESGWAMSSEYKQTLEEADSYIPLYEKLLPKELYSDIDIKYFAENYYQLIRDDADLIFGERVEGSIEKAALASRKDMTYHKAVKEAQSFRYFRQQVRKYGFDTDYLVDHALFYKDRALPETVFHAVHRVSESEGVKNIIKDRFIEKVLSYYENNGYDREDYSSRVSHLWHAIDVCASILRRKGKMIQTCIRLTANGIVPFNNDENMEPGLLNTLSKTVDKIAKALAVPSTTNDGDDEIEIEEGHVHPYIEKYIEENMDYMDYPISFLKQHNNLFYTRYEKLKKDCYRVEFGLTESGRDFADKMEFISHRTFVGAELKQYEPKHYKQIDIF